jgi:hypothetical protein
MERTKLGLLLAKLEITYGTDATPVATANVIACQRAEVNWAPEADPVDQEILDGGFGIIAGKMALPRVTLSFKVEVRGNRTDGVTADISKGAIANVIEIDPLLRACDLAATYTAETTNGARDGYVIYKPTIPSAEGDSLTFYFYSGQKLHKVTGAKGTVKGTLKAGGFGILEFTFSGLYVAVSDAAIPSPITFQDTKPPLYVDSGTTIDAYTGAIFKEFTFDLGNQITRRDDANAADGVRGFLITGRDSKATINPEAVTEATHPWWADWKAGTLKTITSRLGVSGASGSGNRMTTIFTVKQRAGSYGDDNGNRIMPVQLDIRQSALSTAKGNEFQLKFS